MTLVCVYGTLKSGYGNNRLLSGSKCISNGILLNHKLYYSYGDSGFPVAKEDLDSNVMCEVYLVNDSSTLSRLDSLEGYRSSTDSGMYLRRTGKVLNEDGSIVECCYYLGSDEFWDFNSMNACPISDGISKW